jgi:hypothetical protein
VNYRRLLPALLCLFVVACIFGPLASPDRVLATRDMAFLHLPLRADFQRLLAEGLPRWDPWLHGGQPLLSNPHYAAWYPTTWLLRFLPPHVAVQWAILLHAALAFAGAWRLAKRWGCDPPARAFAAIAYTASGYFAALPGLLLIFIGMAWWPWAIAAGDRLTHPAADDSPARRRRAVLALATVLALQLLNGDPAAVLTSLGALVALGIDAHRRAARPWRHLAAAVGLALALSALQTLPSVARLGDSARGAGLAAEAAGAWSTRPLRLIETVFPHLFGDPVRDEEDLYFGWRLHDREYPFLVSIYPGVLVTILGAAALLRGGVPRRLGLGLGVAAGVLLGLGRHGPLWPLVQRLPVFSQLRYPEKFLLLALALLTFAAALELDRLLAIGRRREVESAPRHPLFVSLLLAAGLTIAALVTAGVFGLAPEAAENFVRSHSAVPPSPAVLARGAGYLRNEALQSALLCLAAAVSLLTLRRPARPRAMAVLFCALLAVDLVRHSSALNPTMKREDFFASAPLRQALAPGTRLFHQGEIEAASPIGLRHGPPGEQQLRARLARLEPASAALWDLETCLERDYDLTLTGWGRWARAALLSDWKSTERRARTIDAWSVETRVVPRSPEALLVDLRAGQTSPPLAEILPNPTALGRVRAVPSARFHATAADALAAAREENYALDAREHLVGEDPRVEFVAGEIEILHRTGDEWRLRSNAPGQALVVAAITFDDGWRPTLDGKALASWPTALGQLALAVPAGNHEIELRYRDPWVRVGALLSLVALLLTSLLYSRSRTDANPAASG